MQMLCVGEVECALVDARGLQDVDISAEQGERDRSSDVDAGIFELAFDIKRDRDETAGGGFGEVAGPLVDADGANDLLGLRDLVHLRNRDRDGADRGDEGCGAKDDAKDESSHRPAKEFRRYLPGKVVPAKFG